MVVEFATRFLASTKLEEVMLCSPKCTSHVKLPQLRDRSVFVNLSLGLRPIYHVCIGNHVISNAIWNK